MRFSNIDCPYFWTVYGSRESVFSCDDVQLGDAYHASAVVLPSRRGF